MELEAAAAADAPSSRLIPRQIRLTPSTVDPTAFAGRVHSKGPFRRFGRVFDLSSDGKGSSSLGPMEFDRDDPLCASTLRRTTCDASGSFSFPRVSGGVWRLPTAVKADGTSDRSEGCSMMKRVDVRGGKLVKVTLR